MTIFYNPKQNGTNKHENWTIVDMVNNMIFSSNVHSWIWGEVAHIVIYTLNWTFTCIVLNKKPFKIWMKEKPLIAHMRIFECDVYEHLPKTLRMELYERARKEFSWDATSQAMYIEFGLIINAKLKKVIMSCLMKKIEHVLNNEQDAWVFNHSFV